MVLAYALVMVTDCDIVVNRTGASCLYLKSDVAHDLRGRKNENTCNEALGTYR